MKKCISFSASLIVGMVLSQYSAYAACYGEDENHIVLYRQQIDVDLPNGVSFVAVIRQSGVLGSYLEGAKPNLFIPKGVEVAIFSPGDYPCGSPAVHVEYNDGSESARVDVPHIEGFKGIDVISKITGGSAVGYAHHIFAWQNARFIDVTPGALDQTDRSGGFYTGPFDPGHGAGLLRWTPAGIAGQFDVSYYKWDGTKFIVSTKRVTGGAEPVPGLQKANPLGIFNELDFPFGRSFSVKG